MIQTSIAASATARSTKISPDPVPLDPLLRLAGEINHVHALIVAEHGLDLMCGLIRRGCLAATILRTGDNADANDYDLVLVPDAPALPGIDEMIRIARRSLAPHGRLIAGVRDQKQARALARRLRLNGFTFLRTIHLPAQILLAADLRRMS
ncbi:MAG TPA: hypothetical protein VGM32_11140 [Rhodopila sp.]|jgi:hypothetical protein